MKTALVVDDHSFIRLATRILLEKEGFRVLEASNGAEAMQLARENSIDLTVLDLSLPGPDGLELIERLITQLLCTIIVVLTGQPPEFYAARCQHAGALAYVSKDGDLDVLRQAVKAVMSGHSYFPSLGFSGRSPGSIAASEALLIHSLSSRELSVLRYIARGMSNKDMAEVLMLSDKTVSTYKARLIEKLGMESVVALADFARRNGLA